MKVFICLLILTAISAHAQQKASDAEKASLNWVKELKLKSLNDQILEIKARLAEDMSEVRDERTFVSTVSHDNVCRVSLSIDGFYYRISEKLALFLSKELTISSVKSIQIIDTIILRNDSNSEIAHDAHECCGEIWIKSKNKKLKRKIAKEF